MKAIAIIPLRKGSKGIPGKNKKKLFGRPLYQWVLAEAIFSNLDEIYVFTDDVEILKSIEKEYTWTNKVKGILRSDESASDIASTEMAMLELAKKIDYNFDIICLLQATSPLTTRLNINECLIKLETDNVDSVLSVVETKRFIWSKEGESLNYNFLKRPRRQDFQGFLIENGAVYAVKKETFISNNNRLGGNIAVINMPEETLTEIDELSDWAIIEKLLENRLAIFKKDPKPIKAIVFDVDGVFTDGTVAVSADTELFKSFSLRDGMGFETLIQNNILPIVLTSEDSPIVKNRMNKLKIEHVYSGVKDKFSKLDFILQTLELHRNEIAYIGDDINDMSNLASVAWGICPYNAVDVIKPYADIVLNFNGGDKAIRTAIDFIVKYNHKF